MFSAPPNETPSERRKREREAATAGLDKRLKEEEDLKKEKLMQTNGDEWNTTWGDGECSLGFHHSLLRGLEGLLRHYPRSVYLGCFFWRKMLFRVWTQKWGFPALPPLHGKVLGIERLRVALHLGVMGDVRAFTGNLLPLSKRAWQATSPADATPLQQISANDLSSPSLVDRFVTNEDASTQASVSVSWTYVGANFLAGLVLAQQMDVLKIMIEELEVTDFADQSRASLELDLSVAHWSYGLSGESGHRAGSALHIAVDHAKSVGGLRFATLLLQQRRQQQVGLLDIVTQHTNFTPLQLAVVKDSMDMVELLLQQVGLDVNKKSVDRHDNHQTALHLAVGTSRQPGSSAIVKMLLECPQGCDVTVQDDVDRDTPLHGAVRFKNAELVALFLQHPDISKCFGIRNRWGLTPLEEPTSATVASLLQHVQV